MLTITRFSLTLSLQICASAAAFSNETRAEMPTGPCISSTENVVTCGHGPDALIVLDGTASPSGKLAIAWRAKDEIEDGIPNAEDVENHLVRLEDGKSLGLLVGRYWETGKGGHANHIDQTAVWSADGHWLLVGDSGKWALEALAIYAVDEASGTLERRGLFQAVSKAAERLLMKRVKSDAARTPYVLDIAGDKEVEVDSDGNVSLPMRFQVPKEDKDIDIIVRFKASLRKNSVLTSPIDVKFATQ